MSNLKRKSKDESSFKRKKIKTKKTNDNLMDPVPVEENISSEELTAELLSYQSIREGMLVLGCVAEVKSTYVVMSLPGYLSGIVPADNIADAFTKVITNSSPDANLQEAELSLDLIIKVGMVFPCKVIQISTDPSKRRQSVKLSINPQDVNADLKPSSLYSRMVLFVSVCSIEDHGYIVDVGSKLIQGFLPKTNAEDDNALLKVGEVIPTYLQKVTYSDKYCAKIQLSKLDFNEDFPEVSEDDIKLRSVLPGARIRVDVIEVRHPFVYMKYLNFDACASILSIGGNLKSMKVGSTILVTVLYIHPITHMIYVMLSLKPSPDIYAGYFGLRKFESLKNLRFQCVYKNNVYYKINKGTYGFIRIQDLPSKTDASSLTNTIAKACVVGFHYMDNLVQMTAKPSMVERKIFSPEEVQIGDIFEATVMKHVDGGMIVNVCPGISGFVRRFHMSDVFVTKPELLHPEQSKVKCRVLSTDGKGKLNLTCKESLVNLEDKYVLSSYDMAQKGQLYKGVIVQKTDTYVLIAFFDDVKGIVSADLIPEGSVFFEGQLVSCEVIHCNPSRRKLKLSLKTEGYYSAEELRSFLGETSIETAKSKDSDTLRKTDPMTNRKTILSEESGKLENNSEFDSCKPVKAVIKKAGGGQLNILVNKCKGRVHVTKLGCETEGIYPLRDFFPGQEINVHIIGEFKKNKYLKITSKNVYIKECSLNLPSQTLVKDLKPGTSMIGFVKKVSDVCAVFWLSPTETGVLDYLHLSENPKIVKKAQRYLKLGLSINVTILENKMETEKGSGEKCIALTKIDKKLPEVGRNIIGLVQIGCLERGLILKLPFGYHGVAAITDLTDMYAPVQSVFDKCQRVKYVMCHILEVNHHTKYCQVSLRKSRVYAKAIASSNSLCPEILPNKIKEGDIVKGFVKSLSKSTLSVVFGRNLEGKVHLHSCFLPDCGVCSSSKNIVDKYSVGSVVEVEIEKIEVEQKSFVLKLTDFQSLGNPRYERLKIPEDISWDEVE